VARRYCLSEQRLRQEQSERSARLHYRGTLSRKFRTQEAAQAQAAIRIQVAYRGLVARRYCLSQQQLRRERCEYMARTRYRDALKRRLRAQEAAHTKAATQIQTAYRGFAARRCCLNERHERSRQDALTQRERQLRIDAIEARTRSSAALRIQRAVRRSCFRREEMDLTAAITLAQQEVLELHRLTSKRSQELSKLLVLLQLGLDTRRCRHCDFQTANGKALLGIAWSICATINAACQRSVKGPSKQDEAGILLAEVASMVSTVAHLDVQLAELAAYLPTSLKNGHGDHLGPDSACVSANVMCNTSTRRTAIVMAVPGR